MIDDRYLLDVALGTSEDSHHNVVVLSGVDLEIPLEADLDGDPRHDDEVQLEGAEGSQRILTVRDPDVGLDPDRNLYLYTFRNVPPGVYSLSVKVSDDVWAPVISGILVTKDGASLDGKKLSDRDAPAIPPDPPAEPDEEEMAEDPDSGPDDFGEIIDGDAAR